MHAHQLDIEDQRDIRGHYAADAVAAVAELRRDQQGAIAAHAHALDAPVPAGNELALAEGGADRLAVVVRAVDLRTVVILGVFVVQPAGVVELDLRVIAGDCAGAFLTVDHLELGEAIGGADGQCRDGGYQQQVGSQ